MILLKQLGDAFVSRSGAVVTGRATQGSRLALLALLAAARCQPVTRDKIIALLWPELPTGRARHQLSDALYLLRSALGHDVIRATGDDLALNADLVSSDLVEFERHIDAGELERAVELFAGPLLDGFHLGGAAEFEGWLDGERMRLNQRYACALEQLALRSEQAGDFAAAVGWWRRLAAHDPHSGRIALGLMRSLDARGDRAGALRHARVHAELLQQEFEAQPDPDVAVFAEQLRVMPPPLPVRQPVTAMPRSPAQPEGASADMGTGGAVRRQRTRLYAALAAAAVVVTIVAGAVYGFTERPQAVTADHSIAVLPFVNMSGDSGSDYFSDGLSEQIISVLSRIPGLRVAARTSSFALRDAKLDIRTIGDTLNVGAVLEGSVRRDGNRLRVTAQLIDAGTGYHIWSGEYDRELYEVVRVQDDIAGDIARTLELRLPMASTQPASRRTPDPQAYDLYLRALYLRDNYTPEALRQARAYVDRAIELDPDLARAHALKATVLAPAIFFRYIPREPAITEIRAATARALELDPGMAEAHTALGVIKAFFDHDYPAAERALMKAVELNQNDNFAWHVLANYYSIMGRRADEVAARARGAAVDPLNPRFGYTAAVAYAEADLLPEALAQFDRMLKLDAMDALALGLGPSLPAGPSQVYLKQGRYREAVEDYVRVANLRGATTEEVDSLRAAFQSGGMPAFWHSWLAFDIRHSGNDPDPVRVATIYALAGDTAQTINWLERAWAQQSLALVFVFADPAFAPVREHPRVRRIFQEMNLPAS